MKLTFAEASPNQTELWVELMNSDHDFNMVTTGRQTLSREEVLEDMRETAEIGAKRYVILDGGMTVGAMDYLPVNPKDSCTWLGLLLVRKDLQGKGYGSAAFVLFTEMMKELQVPVIRLGAIVGNEPAHRFWRSKGFIEVDRKPYKHGKEVIVYELALS